MLTTDQLKEHVLNRVGYGIGPWHSARYDEIGPTRYINQQLGDVLEELALGPEDVFIDTKITRSVVSQRQLEAVLLDFWFNHFNVNAGSNNPDRRTTPTGQHVASFQNEAIAPQLLRSFGDMLLATAKSTSMLSYLNNDENRKPERLANGAIVGYNENYAREVMELHTIGVDGGYNQRDVVNATRMMTGWSRDADGFVYYPDRHDTDAKTIMGVDYPAGGQIEEGEAFLAFLAGHPSAARFIGNKLGVRFIADEPPQAVVDAAAGSFSDTAGNLASTISALLSHAAFTNPDAAHFRSKVKPPHRFVASALMGMGAQAQADWSPIEQSLVRFVTVAGDRPYFFGPPTGYPENPEFWLSPPSMLARFEVSELIAYEPRLLALLSTRSGVDGSDLEEAFDGVQRVFLPGGVSETTEAAVKDHAAANAVTSNQRLSAIAHMLLSSPEFLRY